MSYRKRKGARLATNTAPAASKLILAVDPIYRRKNPASATNSLLVNVATGRALPSSTYTSVARGSYGHYGQSGTVGWKYSTDNVNGHLDNYVVGVVGATVGCVCVPVSGTTVEDVLAFRGSTVDAGNGVANVSAGVRWNGSAFVLCAGSDDGFTFDGQNVTGSTRNANTAYRLVMVYGPTNIKLYVNGILDATVTALYDPIGPTQATIDAVSSAAGVQIYTVSAWRGQLNYREISAYTADPWMYFAPPKNVTWRKYLRTPVVAGETGTLASTLGAPTAIITAAHGVSGTSAATFGELSAALSALHGVSGTVASNLGSLTSVISGTPGYSAVVSPILPGLVSAIAALHTSVNGSITSSMPGLSAELDATHVSTAVEDSNFFGDAMIQADFAALTLLGRNVIYTPGTGSPVTVRGIFDSIYIKVDAGNPGISSTSPAVFLTLADLPSDPGEDDSFQISVAGQTYKSHEVEKDGIGGVLILLHLV